LNTKLIAALGMSVLGACSASEEPAVSYSDQAVQGSLPNNKLFKNPGGFAAAASTEGYIDTSNEFFTPQGSNGRSCVTCHAPEDGWSLNPDTITALFEESDGLAPLFVNNLDTDTPTCDMSTRESRWNCTTMLRQGKFTRNVTLSATAQFSLAAVADPFGVSNVGTRRMWFFRRDIPTHTFKTFVTNWDNSNGSGTSVFDGLRTQARGNIVGAQQGPATTTINDPNVIAIANYELTLGHAQMVVVGVGRLDADGALGGPLNAVNQPLVNARFDMYDAWADSDNPRRQQIYRGQELFNTKTRPNGGGACRGCHNASNHGGNVNSTMFNIGVSDPAHARSDMAVFTFQNKTTGETVQTTDGGRAIRNGVWADMNKFDTPTLRGLAARAPYFHNGLAANIAEVIDFYEAQLGFDYTEEEEEDLAAFLNAL